nr:hypothetical protein [Tanacetum cinerariifolium]
TDTSSLGNHNAYMACSLAPQIAYAQMDQQSLEYSPPEAGLVVPVFQKGDDPIDAINHMMSFLTSVVASRYPATNNQLRTSSNPRQQAIINNGRVTIQPIQGRQNFVSADSSRPFPSGQGGAQGKQRVITCYMQRRRPHVQVVHKAKKTKLEDHPRKVKSRLNKASVVDSRASSSVIKSVSNVNANLKCASCNGCLFADNHDKCVVEYINYVNASRKSISAKKPVNRKVWKPTGNVFKTVGYKWTPTGRIFTLIGNVCPLTRIATAPIVPRREPIPIVQSTDKPVVTLVYTRKPRAKHVPNKMEPNKSWGSSSNVSTSITNCRFSKSSSGTVKFGNDHVAKITGYGDYQIGNVTISRVYYVEGLGHNLFSVGQFCDSDLEVAFRQHTCFIRNLEGASKTKYWKALMERSISSSLWMITLDSLINNLARQGLVRGLSKLKFEKDHLCSACARGKSTKKSHKPKSKDTNQEKLYLLHMDLCGPMRVESVNGKKYILVIVDDYSRFTWVKFLPRRIRTDNGTEFVNQTLRDYYEEVGISHETSVARSLPQNGVVERRN